MGFAAVGSTSLPPRRAAGSGGPWHLEAALELAQGTGGRIRDDDRKALWVQANIAPSVALSLLRD